MQGEQIARALGWFSIGLGSTEVAAPGRLSSFLGMEDRARLVRVFGGRELATGAGILAQSRPAPWLWARVGGDILDLAVLGSAFTPRNAKRNRVGVAIGAFAAITVVDVVCARQLSAERSKPQTEAPANVPEIESSITIGKSADELYRLWREPRTLPQIMGHFAEVTATNADRAHWVVRGPNGWSMAWDTQVVEDRPGGLVRWKSLAGAKVPNEGTLRLRPAPGDRGTEVSLSVRFDPPGGALGDAAAKVAGVVPSMFVDKALRRFKSLAETGEIATIERQPAARNSGRDK